MWWGRNSATVGGTDLVVRFGQHLSVSDRCYDRIAAVNRREGKAGRPLRLTIGPGGCNGFKYEFAFDETPLRDAEDVVFAKVVSAKNSPVTHSMGVAITAQADEAPTAATLQVEEEAPSRVVVDTGTLDKLEGAVLDFFVELKGSGFMVVGNQLVDESCACKQSMTLKPRQAKPV